MDVCFCLSLVVCIIHACTCCKCCACGCSVLYAYDLYREIRCQYARDQIAKPHDCSQKVIQFRSKWRPSKNVLPNDPSTNKNGGVVFSPFRPPGSPVRPFGAIFFYAVYGDRSYSSDISIDEMSLIGTRHMALTQDREAVCAAEGSAQPCMAGGAPGAARS